MNGIIMNIHYLPDKSNIFILDENQIEKVGWGYYSLSKHDYISNPFCWLPSYLHIDKYNIDYVKDLTIRLEDEIDNIWEGPYIKFMYWKFRFTTYEDQVLFKLITE